MNNYWDRGLTGIALDPQFGTAGHNFVYVNYTYNRDPRDATPVVPKWGVPGQQYDECPAPATTDPPRAGCVVMMRVTRLTAVKNALGWEMTGPETQLLASGCFQFGSHASGDVAFGPDGKLYASAGEGASFDTMDYGQYANPCADPGDEGGSLRSAGLPQRERRARRRRHDREDGPGHRVHALAGHREQLAGRLRPAQPVAAHLPARAATSSGPATSAAASGRRSTGSPT